jgi:hypothetical protein
MLSHVHYCLILLVLAAGLQFANGFAVLTGPTDRSGCCSPLLETRLFGKGFRSAKNKQAALAQKMELAKKTNQKEEGGAEEENLPAEEKKVKEDARAEFARLLAQSQPMKHSSTKTGGSVFGGGGGAAAAGGSGGTKKKATAAKSIPAKKKTSKESTTSTSEQEEEDELSSTTFLEPGGKARRRDFEPLIDVSTGQPLGPLKAAELVPWVPPFVTQYLLVLADPRRQSTELRQAIQYLQSTSFDRKNKVQFLAIGADDSPKAFRTEINNNNQSFRICLDSSLEWMTAYGCTNQYGLHLLVLNSDGILQSEDAGISPADVCPKVTTVLSNWNEK